MFHGSLVALVTPHASQREIDFVSLPETGSMASTQQNRWHCCFRHNR